MCLTKPGKKFQKKDPFLRFSWLKVAFFLVPPGIQFRLMTQKIGRKTSVNGKGYVFSMYLPFRAIHAIFFRFSELSD